MSVFAKTCVFARSSTSSTIPGRIQWPRGNAPTEIKERIRREKRRDEKEKKREKKRYARARTLVFPESSRRQPRQSAFDRLHGDGNISRGGCIIGISAPGRVKSGRRDQWLTRIVGAVRKIPYLHSKIRARASLSRAFSFSLSSTPRSSSFCLFFSLVLAQSAGAYGKPRSSRPPSPLRYSPRYFAPAKHTGRLNQIAKLDTPSNPRKISRAMTRASAFAVSLRSLMQMLMSRARVYRSE